MDLLVGDVQVPLEDIEGVMPSERAMSLPLATGALDTTPFRIVNCVSTEPEVQK